jgi:peptidoglycan/LPS O-acetylase OafA/YrhL
MPTASDYFSLERSNVLKGLLAIGIVLGHFAWSADSADIPLFRLIFCETGKLIVSVFFFISGYGLLSSYLVKREKYLDRFLSKRLPKIIVPFFLAIVLFQTIQYFCGHTFDLAAAGQNLLHGEVSDFLPYSWFVFAIIYFYISFLCVFRYCTNDITRGLFYLAFCSVAEIIITKCLGFGGHWYVSTLAFNAGLLWKYKEEVILTFLLKKGYAVLVIVLIPLLILCLGGSHIASMPLYPIWLLTVFSLVKVPTSRFTRYLGSISYEIYLAQCIPLVALRAHIHTYIHTYYDGSIRFHFVRTGHHACFCDSNTLC